MAWKMVFDIQHSSPLNTPWHWENDGRSSPAAFRTLQECETDAANHGMPADEKAEVEMRSGSNAAR